MPLIKTSIVSCSTTVYLSSSPWISFTFMIHNCTLRASTQALIHLGYVFFKILTKFFVHVLLHAGVNVGTIKICRPQWSVYVARISVL